MSHREFESLAAPETLRETVEALDIGGGTERVPLREAIDRILASDVEAPIDVPGFDRAAMDGYAVVASDTADAESGSVELELVGTIHAGSDPEVTVAPGTLAEIATGAVLPDGADAVVPVEETTRNGDQVTLESAVRPGAHVMPRGADIAAGSYAYAPGTRLGPRHLGVLAAVGMESVPVRRHPRVGIISTGEELVQPGDSIHPEAGQIYDVNTHTISGAVKAAGGEPRVYETAADELEALSAQLEGASAECDLLLTSGSTSVGSLDLLHRLLDEEGEKLLHGVAVKPGKPVLVGRLFDTPYIGLPGYPVSALSIFRTFVAPVIRDATGRPAPPDQTREATLGTPVHYDGSRHRLVAVGLVEDRDGSLVAYAPAKGSGATTTLGQADGVVQMAAATSVIEAGTDVAVERFDARDPVPSLLGVGDPDPLVPRLLADLPTPRYLTLGPAEARTWFDDGIPDVLVTAGEASSQAADPLARWRREWGFVVPNGNPANVEGDDDLTAGVQFANLDSDLALRGALDRHIASQMGVETPESAAAADDPDLDPPIEGYHRGLPGIESAARAVASGRADAGLGLRTTAERLDLDFVSAGWQSVALLVNDARSGKESVRELADLLARSSPTDPLPGYERA